MVIQMEVISIVQIYSDILQALSSTVQYLKKGKQCVYLVLLLFIHNTILKICFSQESLTYEHLHSH